MTQVSSNSNPQTRFITDTEIYERVILEAVPAASRFLWLATADLKDLHVKGGRRMVPFLKVLSDLLERGVQIRLMHAKEPGPAFREDFDRFPNLFAGLERVLCPRIHFKCVVVDGVLAYSGSANLTGAGVGAKSENRRNFESGIITTDPALIEPIMSQFDSIWIGERCGKCGRKRYCAEPVAP
jgi:phosphatidylserine/phosphatidylglycerophosphate/cardiolipin synthase-like enzyme